MRSLQFNPNRNLRQVRRGVVTLELIIWMPILIIFLLAIVQFAIMMQVNRQVAYASRFGAKLASEVTRNISVNPNLSNFNMAATPNNLKTQIDAYLANQGLTNSCEVILEQNACVQNPTQVDTSAACNCGASPTTVPGGEVGGPAGTAYVKVTVCVPLTGNVPNCLSTFGLDITGVTFEHSTVFRIETNNTPPTTVLTTAAASAGTVTVPGGGLPTTDLAVTIEFANLDVNTTTDVTFNASSSSDIDNPFSTLTFLWSTTGTALDPLNSEVFRSRFSVPGFPGVASMATHTVTLTTTDTCAESTMQTLTLTLIRN